MVTGFVAQRQLFKLNRSRWFAGEIIEYSIDSSDLIDDSAHNSLKNCEWNLSGLCGHEIDGIDCAQCHCIIIGSLITHNTNGTHVGEGCKVLVRHPGRIFSVFFLVVGGCFVDFFTVDVVCILYDAYFFLR